VSALSITSGATNLCLSSTRSWRAFAELRPQKALAHEKSLQDCSPIGGARPRPISCRPDPALCRGFQLLSEEHERAYQCRRSVFLLHAGTSPPPSPPRITISSALIRQRPLRHPRPPGRAHPDRVLRASSASAARTNARTSGTSCLTVAAKAQTNRILLSRGPYGSTSCRPGAMLPVTR